VTALVERNPPVTWIMPVRNGMPFVRATLESIARQKYEPFRMIAWDNGSTDGTQRELHAWIPGRIAGEVVTDEPLPLGLSRAALVRRAQTELLACIDADDINLPERLTRQVPEMLRDHRLVAVGCVPFIIDENDRALPDWYYPTEDADIRWRSGWQTSFNASSVLFRRSAVLAAGNYRDIDRSQDLDLWMRLRHQGKMRNLTERLVKYRRHTQNLTAGMRDYYATDRSIAERNVDDLFDGLRGESAMRLWEAVYPHYGRSYVGPHHLRLLRRYAVAAARSLGEHDEYFVRTSYFALQRHYVVKNIVRCACWLDGDTMMRLDRCGHWLRNRTRRRPGAV
jgi:glycosyltransferase involved in cell wall biosynthesis